jgi:hypothetical protein
MPNTTPHPDDADDPDDTTDDHGTTDTAGTSRDAPGDDEARRQERAEDLYEAAEADETDPITRREALEGELEEEGLSDEGEGLGEHIE